MEDGNVSFQYKSNSFGSWLISDWLLGNIAGWLIILLSCGYPLSASLAIFLKMPSTPINFAARLIYMLMALYLICASLFKKQVNGIKVGGLLILLFWFFYLIRVVYDLEVVGVKVLATTPFNFYSFSIGNCFLPAVGILLTARFIELSSWPFRVWLVLLIVNILMLFLIKEIVGNFSMKVFTNRLFIGSKDGREQVINPILISFYGGQLIVVSVAVLLFRSNLNLIWRILSFVSLPIGLLCLFLGASRSPILTTTLIIFFMVFFYFRRIFKFNITSFFKISIMAALIFYAGSRVAGNYKVKDFLIVERLLNFTKDRVSGKKEVRDFEQQAALNDFLSSPVLGRSIVNSFDNTYPHNIAIEVAMSLGIIGIIVFLPMLFLLLYKSFILPYYYPSMIIHSVFIIMTYFLTFFSGSIWASTNFWAVAAMILSLQKHQLLNANK